MEKGKAPKHCSRSVRERLPGVLRPVRDDGQKNKKCARDGANASWPALARLLDDERPGGLACRYLAEATSAYGRAQNKL
jgi:hypothetical protein